MTIATFKVVSSGTYLDLAKLTPDDINVKDITPALNNLVRFTGHWTKQKPISVAQHTLLTVLIARQRYPEDKVLQLDCLLHDFPEAYYGDIASPVKNFLGPDVKAKLQTIDTVVYSKLWPKEVLYSNDVFVKRVECDLIALDIERRHLYKVVSGDEKDWPTIPQHNIPMQLFSTVKRVKYVNLTQLYEELLQEVQTN